MTKQIKRSLYLLTAVIAVIAIVLAVAPQFAFAQAQGDVAPQADISAYFSGGDGSASNPYLITNEQELDNIRYAFEEDEEEGDGVYKSFRLVNNIYIQNNPWTPIRGYYTGTFDGNNKTIYDLNFDVGSDSNYGLFANNRGTIKNVNFSGVNFSSTNQIISANVGVIAGINSGTITNCKILNSEIKVSSYNANVGGIVGRSDYGMINYCENYANITGSGNVGGIVGYTYGASIINCKNNGTITYLYEQQNGCAAGMVGKGARNTYIQDCRNMGQIVYGSPRNILNFSLRPCMANIVGWAQSASLVDCTSNTELKPDYSKLTNAQKQYCSDGAIGREGQ